MTRGISYEDSLKLLIKGFIFSSISTNMEKRERILKIINDNWRWKNEIRGFSNA